MVAAPSSVNWKTPEKLETRNLLVRRRESCANTSHTHSKHAHLQQVCHLFAFEVIKRCALVLVNLRMQKMSDTVRANRHYRSCLGFTRH